jgi:multisubunit Na+/H+ antiporter MnhC subunit
MVIATVLATALASFYLVFGWRLYLLIIAGAIYNIGVNSHLVLLGGAFVKTPIDLTTAKRAFGNRQAFNVRTFLISVPKLLLPVLLYSLGYYTVGPELGYAFVAGAGIIGFAFRNKVFSIIERLYKTEKYKTIAAYKGGN